MHPFIIILIFEVEANGLKIWSRLPLVKATGIVDDSCLLAAEV